jgi:putative transposase
VICHGARRSKAYAVVGAASAAIFSVSQMLAVGKGGYSALRRGRASAPGQTYLITATCEGRRPLFDDFDRATRCCRTLHELSLWERHRLVCWVLMPDHLHALVELGPGEGLSLVVQRLKSNLARALRIVEPRLATVWSRGFHDHAVRKDESLVEIARYIVANPVRAGLVARAGLYPFWDAAWLRAEKDRD